MRYIIYGAGGIGGTIGARLFQNGQEVILIARGDHLKAIRDRGLTFESPSEKEVLPIPCAGHPSEIDFREEDVVFMTMKAQHTLAALEELRDAAGENIPVICCQNGVANERMALRRFRRVYGMLVFLPSTYLVPGAVQTEAKTTTGILDVGCYPSGLDSIAEEVTCTLSASRFSSCADPDIMRMKYAKLLRNLNNSMQAVCGPENEARDRDISLMLNREAVDCYKAAGIDWAGPEEFKNRVDDHIQLGTVDGRKRAGGSSWQSIARGAGSIESDYLNGEIILLGRLHGIPTPANFVLQQLANRLARDAAEPGSYSLDQVKALIAQAGGKF